VAANWERLNEWWNYQCATSCPLRSSRLVRFILVLAAINRWEFWQRKRRQLSKKFRKWYWEVCQRVIEPAGRS